MGRKKLTDSDYSSEWPKFLHDIYSKRPAASFSAPLLFNLDSKNGKSGLEDCIKNNGASEIIDNYDEQLAELLLSKDAHLYKANDEVKKASIEDLISKHYGKKKSYQMGNWAYFQWDGRIVHVLEPELFDELRTIRNRDLITAKEQQTLSKFNVACVGMSVGSSSALAISISGISNRIKLADGAVISGSNLNRILTGVASVGEPKEQVIAKKIYEMNPYAKVHLHDGVVNKVNINKLFDEPWGVNLIVDEIDDLEMKIMLRLEARRRGVPVIMATELADSVMLDIERYDKDKNYKLFHGLAGDIENLLGRELSQREWMKFATKIIGPKNVPLNMQESLLKIGSKVVTHPQLGATAMMTGGLLAYAAKQIALGKDMASSRTMMSFDDLLIRGHKSIKNKLIHRKHTKVLESTLNSI